MKNKLFAILMIALILVFSAVPAFAAQPTDEVKNYVISCDINDDGTAVLTYHIEWEVLESDGIGPVSWLSIGIPSSDCVSFDALSNNISNISYSGDGGSFLIIDFYDEYYEGEIISFDFQVVQGSMYQMNLMEEGYTTYSFTPGWFNGVEIDQLTIKWNNENLASWSPECLIIGGYNTWETSLGPGEYYTITVNYPNDAYNFDESTYIMEGDYGYYDDGYNDGYNSFASALAGFAPVIMFLIIFSMAKKADRKYREKANLGGTTKKVTRTKVTYYPECQGCGAPRGEGEEECSYCGRSFIESEEVLSEEEIKDEDKEAMEHDEEGEYKYSSIPNTFVRVHVVHIPVARPSGGERGGRGGRGGSTHSSRGGGCAHSSCACACASCACACACACAGGGRAGCTTKDFYNTKLKLKQIEKATKKR